MTKISRYSKAARSPWLPDMLLDAPADLLYARKGEATPEYLDRQRGTYLEQGKKVANFVRVDATQPLDSVFDDVQNLVLEFHSNDGWQT